MVRNLFLVLFLLCFGFGFVSCETDMDDDVTSPVVTPEPTDPSDDDCEGEVFTDIDFFGDGLSNWVTDNGGVPVADCGEAIAGANVRCVRGGDRFDTDPVTGRPLLSDWYYDAPEGYRVYLHSVSCSECEVKRGDKYVLGWTCTSSIPLFEFPSCDGYIARKTPEGCS